MVTNLSQMSVEYFHPKTTPNTSIRTAVRMSTAMPGNAKYFVSDLNAKLQISSDKFGILRTDSNDHLMLCQIVLTDVMFDCVPYELLQLWRCCL